MIYVTVQINDTPWSPNFYFQLCTILQKLNALNIYFAGYFMFNTFYLPPLQSSNITSYLRILRRGMFFYTMPQNRIVGIFGKRYGSKMKQLR